MILMNESISLWRILTNGHFFVGWRSYIDHSTLRRSSVHRFAHGPQAQYGGTPANGRKVAPRCG
jgi:hypothetical protein